VTVGTTRQHMASSSTQMMYNVMEDLSKLRITLSFYGSGEDSSAEENILKLLDDPSERT
jgi:hypothetical protein